MVVDSQIHSLIKSFSNFVSLTNRFVVIQVQNFSLSKLPKIELSNISQKARITLSLQYHVKSQHFLQVLKQFFTPFEIT